MNPASFQQAMMAGQGMPQSGNLPNQIKLSLFNRFQQQANTGGWQAMLQPGERVNFVMQLTTSLNLAQPNMSQEGALRNALMFEAERFSRSTSKEQYFTTMRQQLQMLQQKRLQQSQNAGMGQLGNPQSNMSGMMGQPMQNSMSNQGNPMAQQFNPQLGRPMQVSPLPMNGQAAQGMPMGAMPNQNQGFQAPQQQGGNAQLSQAEKQNINRLAQGLLQRANDEQKAAVLKRFQSMNAGQQNAVRAQFGDPLIAHFRNQAHQLYIKHQAGQNGMPNAMMGQQTPMIQRPQPQPQMGGQQDQAVDFSQFMTQMTGQQQDAIRSADSGQLVVPASNNPMMNQGLNGMPMGLTGGQVGAQGMNNPGQMQNPMQQRPGNINTGQAAAMRIAQSQAQARTQIQGQAGQPNQQNQMAPQMRMGGNNQSPMLQGAQPAVAPGQQQQPGATPQQQRPTPTPTPQMRQQGGQFTPQMAQAMQKAGMANGQTGQIRRQLPPDLPPGLPQNIRNYLQTTDDEQYKTALDHIRRSPMAGQLQNGVGLGPQGGQMPQMGQGIPNQMMGLGQNPQMNAQLQQLRMAQQRPQQQPQNLNQAKAGAPMGLIPATAEVIQQMDARDFPRSLLQANNSQMVPAHIKKFRELKEWIIANPAMAGSLTVPKLTQYQAVMWSRQMNGNAQGMVGQPNNTQGGAPGPAPTAPMMPPSRLNNMGQQSQQLAGMGMNNSAVMMQQLQGISSVTATPQDVAYARQSGRFPPQMSDDELRMKLTEMKRQQMLRKLHEQRNLQMQAPPQASSNQMPNQRMPQSQMPQPPQRLQKPGSQTPQLGMQTPNIQNKQTPRPGQPQPAGLKTPQQQVAKNLKRSAPEEVVEIPDNNQTQSQAPQMQVTKSQQAQNAMQGNQAGQQAAPDAQGRAINQRFGAILQEVKSKHQSGPHLELSSEERQQLVNKVAEFKQIITRTEGAIHLFFGRVRDEERTKMYLKQYWHLADNVNPKEGILLSQPTVRAADFERLMQPFKDLVIKMMQPKKQQQEAAQKAQNTAGVQISGQQQPPSQGNAQVAQGGRQELNAANLDQHNSNLRQQAAVQGHRRSSSKAQPPAAPTAGPGQNPFNFNTPSPQGVPKYGEGAGNLEKLNLPRKRQKKDGQPPSGSSTPAQQGVGATASPQISRALSPQVKKQPIPDEPQMPQPPRHACRDPSCEFSRKGFDTAEQLAEHFQQAHAPPADPIKYSLENLGAALGLNADGTVKTEVPDAKPTQHATGKATPQIKAEMTPPAGATPLNKIPMMKGSPAMDRLKTPQQSSKPPAPTSAAAPTADKAIKQDEAVDKPDASTGEEMALDLDFDPWKDSAIQQNDLSEWFKPFDTFTGDWGNDRALRSPQLTPATTPDTNVTDKTASTRNSEILDSDALNMTLAMNPAGDGDFIAWKEVEGWEPGIMDPDLMNDLAAVGIDESMVLKLDNKTDIDEWEAMFGPDSNIDGNKVPGWENTTNELVF